MVHARKVPLLAPLVSGAQYTSTIDLFVLDILTGSSYRNLQLEWPASSRHDGEQIAVKCVNLNDNGIELCLLPFLVVSVSRRSCFTARVPVACFSCFV